MGWDDTWYFTTASQATVYWLLFWRHKHMVFVGFLLAFTKGTMAIAWPSWYPFLHMRKIRQEKHADTHTHTHTHNTTLTDYTHRPRFLIWLWMATYLFSVIGWIPCSICMLLVPMCCFIIRLAAGTQSCCLYDEPSTWNEYEYEHPFTKLRTYRRVYMDDGILTLYTSISTCLPRVNWLDPPDRSH